jgi:hypothetical protein
MWDAAKAAISWIAYLGPGVPGSPDVSPYAAPARATDLSGLPPAYISVMEFDPLRDEGIGYAQALLSAGVTAELHLYAGTFHGAATTAPDAAIVQRERAEEIAVLATALTGGGTRYLGSSDEHNRKRGRRRGRRRGGRHVHDPQTEISEPDHAVLRGRNRCRRHVVLEPLSWRPV